MALLLLFIYRPLADNIRLSFFDWNISDPKAQFVGLSNYAEWFTRSDTRQIVLNTAVFTVAAVVGSMVLGLMLAMLLDQPLRGRNLVRSAVFTPFVISGAAVGLAAQFVFDPHFGLVQDLLHRVGVGRVAVLKDGVLQQVDAPRALYDNPANTFVATFIGALAMNLIDATVADGVVKLPDLSIPVPRGVVNRVLIGVRSPGMWCPPGLRDL